MACTAWAPGIVLFSISAFGVHFPTSACFIYAPPPTYPVGTSMVIPGFPTLRNTLLLNSLLNSIKQSNGLNKLINLAKVSCTAFGSLGIFRSRLTPDFLISNQNNNLTPI